MAFFFFFFFFLLRWALPSQVVHALRKGLARDTHHVIGSCRGGVDPKGWADLAQSGVSAKGGGGVWLGGGVPHDNNMATPVLSRALNFWAKIPLPTQYRNQHTNTREDVLLNFGWTSVAPKQLFSLCPSQVLTWTQVSEGLTIKTTF